MRESTLSWIGNFEEKIDLSHIYLAVPKDLQQKILAFLHWFLDKNSLVL